MTRPARAILAAVALLALFGAHARAQSPIETAIANEFLQLELAGWRLPDPVEECLTSLPLRALEPMSYGSEDMVDQPELVDPPGPHFRVVRIDSDPRNRRFRIVQFEWLVQGRSIRDSFAFAMGGDPSAGSGRPTMQREPERLVIRRECFGS
jgi:hypothetical protein